MEYRSRKLEQRLSSCVSALRRKVMEIESLGWLVFSLAIILPVVAWVGFGFTFWF